MKILQKIHCIFSEIAVISKGNNEENQMQSPEVSQKWAPYYASNPMTAVEEINQVLQIKCQ